MIFLGRLKDAVISAGNKIKQEIDDLVQENNQLQAEEIKQENSKYIQYIQYIQFIILFYDIYSYP